MIVSLFASSFVNLGLICFFSSFLAWWSWCVILWRGKAISLCTHLRHKECSSQSAHMILRATTINLPFVHPCKLKGPENARVPRKYNTTNTLTGMNSWFVKNALLAQTTGYRQPKTLWRLETAYKRNSLLLFDKQYHRLPTANHYLHRDDAQSRLSKSSCYGNKQSVWRV